MQQTRFLLVFNIIKTNNIHTNGLLVLTPMKSTDFGASFFGMIFVSPAGPCPLPLLLQVCSCLVDPLHSTSPDLQGCPCIIPKCEHRHVVYGHVNRRWAAKVRKEGGGGGNKNSTWFIHFGNGSEGVYFVIPCERYLVLL